MKLTKLLCGIAMLACLTACDPPDADDVQSAQTQQAMQQANQRLGMPQISNFKEKRNLKEIYEDRDKEILTYSYVMNEMKGCLVYLGVSVGYGIPYATQYSNPHRPLNSSFHDTAMIDQPEPNGLFMPSDAEGTWIMLEDPEGKDTHPVYVEPRVIVSPFRMTVQECHADGH